MSYLARWNIRPFESTFRSISESVAHKSAGTFTVLYSSGEDFRGGEERVDDQVAKTDIFMVHSPS